MLSSLNKQSNLETGKLNLKLIGLLGLVSIVSATLATVVILQKTARQPETPFIPGEPKAQEEYPCRTGFDVPTPTPIPPSGKCDDPCVSMPDPCIGILQCHLVGSDLFCRNPGCWDVGKEGECICPTPTPTEIPTPTPTGTPAPTNTPTTTPISSPTPTSAPQCPGCPDWILVESEYPQTGGDCNFKITWDDVEYEDGYYVYRRNSTAGNWEEIANVLEDTTEHGDLNVPCQGEEYTYRVQPYTDQVCPTSLCKTAEALCPCDYLCELIEAYQIEPNGDWNQITPNEFLSLNAGETVYFVVYSVEGATGARMRVNTEHGQGNWQNALGPIEINSSEVFYIQYQIPDNTYTFEVEAELLP